MKENIIYSNNNKLSIYLLEVNETTFFERITSYLKKNLHQVSEQGLLFVSKYYLRIYYLRTETLISSINSETHSIIYA